VKREQQRHVPERREQRSGDDTAARALDGPRQSQQHHGEIDRRGADEQVAVVRDHGVATASIK
jgi:hypothetical protein